MCGGGIKSYWIVPEAQIERCPSAWMTDPPSKNCTHLFSYGVGGSHSVSVWKSITEFKYYDRDDDKSHIGKNIVLVQSRHEQFELPPVCWFKEIRALKDDGTEWNRVNAEFWDVQDLYRDDWRFVMRELFKRKDPDVCHFLKNLEARGQELP